MTELDTTETRFQAATRVEGAETAEARGAFGDVDGEGAETRALLGRVRMADYLGAAAAGIGAGGAAAELNAALKVPIVGGSGGVSIPWEVLLTPEARQAQRQAEQRAFTDHRRILCGRHCAAADFAAAVRHGHHGRVGRPH